MRIMGIDPGTARAGWGVIDISGNKPKPVAYGCIITGKDETPENRLLYVYRSADELIRKYNPDAVSIEELFFSKNVKTAIAVGQARGVLLLASAKNKKCVHSYSPLGICTLCCIRCLCSMRMDA